MNQKLEQALFDDIRSALDNCEFVDSATAHVVLYLKERMVQDRAPLSLYGDTLHFSIPDENLDPILEYKTSLFDLVIKQTGDYPMAEVSEVIDGIADTVERLKAHFAERSAPAE